ncbi:chorismate mutase [Pseudoroseomonas sp. WGS1072]|uniref:chorismate mutase n=1 Tax=Roseomonas sp. WGS1072 TaxID=3366816 RepID=UPI003BF4254C
MPDPAAGSVGPDGFRLGGGAGGLYCWRLMRDPTAEPPPAAPLPASSAPPAALATLRAQIDTLDDALHDLLMRRADLVAEMAGGRAKGGGAIFRPGREASILRRLLARNRGALRRTVVLRVWREIIAASLAQQGPFSVAVAPGETLAGEELADLARGHFGGLTPLHPHPTPCRALAALERGEASLAVLPAPREEEPAAAAWWTRMQAPRLQVVAALPFLAAGAAPGACVVAALPPEPTGRDHSLLRLAPVPGQPRSHAVAALRAALEAAGLPPLALLWREQPEPAMLAVVEGFLEAGDPRLAALPFPHLQILGAYAEPEPEE